MKSVLYAPLIFPALLAFLLAFIPAKLAWNKYRNPRAWYVFGLFLFLPALITILLLDEISFEKSASDIWGKDWKDVMITQRSAPKEKGWYLNSHDQETLHWWDGESWKPAWLRIDGSPLPTNEPGHAWSRIERLHSDRWTAASLAASERAAQIMKSAPTSQASA